MIVTVPSHDVQVGDTVTFLGTPHLITSIEEHPRRSPTPARSASRPTTTAGDHDRRRHLRSSHRPADQRQQGSVVTLDLVAGVVAGLGTVAIVLWIRRKDRHPPP